MPTPIPPLTFTHAAQVHAAAHGGLVSLKAQLEANLKRDFGLDEPEPDVDDLLDIFFHTFVSEDGQEFLVRPDGDRMVVDLCERELRTIKGNPEDFRTVMVPLPFSPPEPAMRDTGEKGAVETPSDDAEFPPGSKQAFARLQELGALKAGWLDGKGMGITNLAVASAAYVILKRPDIVALGLGLFPTERGGITLEFRKDGWSYTVEALRTGSLEWYGVSESGPESIEPMPYEVEDDAFWEAFDSRIGRRT